MTRFTRRIRLAVVGIALALGMGLTGCTSDADVVSENLSTAADNFEIPRRVVFYNGITGEYILEVQGLCSLGNYDTASRLSVTCKTGKDAYKKHFLGLSDNVTFFAEQLDPANVSAHHFARLFSERFSSGKCLRSSTGISPEKRAASPQNARKAPLP